MFASVRNFLYRHRRKFLIGGSIIGGVALLSRYAEFKFLQWHDANTQSIIDKQKRRQHYEKTRETANATVLNLSISLSKVLSTELDTDCILQAIRKQPHDKLRCWEDLKLVGFSRCLSVVYTSALVGSFVHVHLMLLGSYTYADANPQGKGVLVNDNIQERYLTYLQILVQDGLPKLYNKILKAVKLQFGPLPLDKPISLEVLEGLLKDTILLLAGEDVNDSCDSSYKLNPWSQFVFSDFKKTVPENPEEKVFNSITEELIDLIDSKDFDFVLHSLVQNGLNYILDCAAGFYPQPKTMTCSGGCTVSSVDATEILTNGVKEDDTGNISSNEDDSNEILGTKKEAVTAKKEAVTTKQKAVTTKQEAAATKKETNVASNSPLHLSASFTKSTLPLAKLVPIVSGLVHSSLSPAPGHLLQSTILNELLENYCFNVYEAFSVKV